MEFTDGVKIDTNGELRKLHLHDGWYVVGQGMLIPVRTEEDADQIIKERNERNKA